MGRVNTRYLLSTDLPATDFVMRVLVLATAILVTSPPSAAPALDDPRACAEAMDAAWRAFDTGRFGQAVDALPTTLDGPGCEAVGGLRERLFLAGRAALHRADYAGAIVLLEQAVSAPDLPLGDRPFPGEATYILALAREAGGAMDDAHTTYRRLAQDHPADARVGTVLPLLSHLAPATDGERLERAAAAVERRNYSGAERQLMRLVRDRAQVDLSGAPLVATTPLVRAIDTDDFVGELTYQLAHLWYSRLRQETARAVPLFSTLAQSQHARAADATYYLARCYMRLEDYRSAATIWRTFADHHPTDSRRHESAYYAGWLHMDRERFADALPGFEQYLGDFPEGARAERAAWYVAWCLFRLERYDEALQHFERLSRGGYRVALKGEYWAARCLALLGRFDQANRVYGELAERRPFSYYGLMARQRLGLEPIPVRVLDEAPTGPWTTAQALAPEAAGLAILADLIDRSSPFRSLRFLDHASPHADLAPAERALVEQAAGLAHVAYRALGRSERALLRAPVSQATLPTWLAALPRPFDRWMADTAHDSGVDPLLVYSHMQVESGYNPRLVSYADAMGLLQLIQATAQRVAVALEEPYAEGMLMEPAANIRFGCWYLGALIEEFDGQLPLAMAAYNAGAHPMHIWVKQNAALPFDMFVEEIAYDQAREYLKRIIGIYSQYLHLYADRDVAARVVRLLLPKSVRPVITGAIDW